MKISSALMAVFCIFSATAAGSDEHRKTLISGRLAGMKITLLAVDLSDGRAVAAVDADRAVIPASTMKALTTACALERLGPAHVFSTDFLVASSPDAEGKVPGPLFVRGRGNPLFRAEDLWAALVELEAGGLRRIGGGLVFDDSLYGSPGRPSSWPNKRVPDPYDAPQGALAVSWNSVQVIVRPGRPGQTAKISTFPVRAGARIVNAVRTDSNTRIVIDVVELEDGRAQIRVSGTIRNGAKAYKNWVHLGDPGRATAEAAAEILAGTSIDFHGTIRRGKVPDAAHLLLSHKSPPLAQIVSAVNKYSSNFGAEMLVRALDRQMGNEPASTPGGLAVIDRCLERWGVDRGGMVLSDGSGYSRSNRLSSRTLVDALVHAWRSPAWGPEFVASLPRAGEDGSLKNRLKDLRGTVRAKTGSLRGVAALAGYAQTESTRQLAFAILINRGSSGTAPSRSDIDRLLRKVLSSDHHRGEEKQDPGKVEKGSVFSSR